MLSKSLLKSKLGARAFSQAPVQVDFSLIQSQSKQLYDNIEEAYDDDGLGVMVVNNIPGFKEKRERLLPLAQKLGNLNDEKKARMETPEWHYSVGWSHGKEKFMGMPDLFKGSFYANPIYDEYQSHIDENGNRTTYQNIWPNEDVPGIEQAFKGLGGFINGVGIEVAKNLDLYIKARESRYETGKLERILSESHKTIGRLLHYFPVKQEDVHEDMQWCGWHNDHGTLTGLVSAMYLDQDGKEVS